MAEPLDRISAVFSMAPFIADLGIRPVAAGEGWVETELTMEERLRQQHGFAHAGVVTTLADHTAGAAASTAVGEGRSVLTADFTVHLLRPATGDVLHCRGEIVRAGRSLIVAEAKVTIQGKLCVRYIGTMAVVERGL
jgi:uncharacterized protein (TIGR00369 family)